MDKPISLFRKSFLYSVGTVILIGILFRLFPFIFSLVNSNPTQNKEVILWGISSIYSVSFMALFVLVFPWLILSFYGEWFYTRALSRDILFKKIMNEYLKWFLPISVLAFALVYIYNSLGVSFPMYYRTTFDVVSITLYLTVIMSGNSKTLFRMLKYGFFILIIMSLISAYREYLDPYGVNDYSPFLFVVRIVWAMYIFLCYKIVSEYDEDLDINVPGKSDDENRSMSNMWLFSKESKGKKIELKKESGFIGKLYSSFKLMTENTKVIYVQLVVVISVFSCFFGFRYGFAYILMMMSQNELYIGSLPSEVDILFIISLSILIICTALLIIFSNPKYMFIANEEFLLTRAINKGKLYINNYLIQGVFVTFITLVLYYITMYFSLDLFDGVFDFTNILLTIIWFYIAGEMGIVVMISLFMFDAVTTSLNNGYMSELTSSLFINILTSGYLGVSVWLGAIFFRVWDYQHFVNKEIGWFKGIKSISINLAKNYVVPFIVLNGVIIFVTFANPLTRFFNLYPDFRFNRINSNVYSDLYVKTSNVYENNGIIQKSLNDPYYKEQYLDIIESYINSIANHITYTSNYINYSNYNNSLKIISKILGKKPHGKFIEEKEEEKKIGYWFSIIGELKEIDIGDLKYTEKYMYLKAVYSYIQEDYEQSAKFSKKVFLMSNNSQRLEVIARLYKYMLMNKESIEAYKKSIKLDSKPKRYIYNQIGDLYWANNQYKSSLESYSDYLINNSDPEDYKRYFYNKLCDRTVSFVLINSKDFSSLLSSSQTKNDLYSICENNEIRSKYAKNLLIKNEYKHRIDINQNIYYYNYAEYYLNNNNLEKAEISLKESIKERTFADNLGELALVQAKMHKYDESRGTINNYLKKLQGMISFGFYDRYSKSSYNYKIYLASMIIDKTNRFEMAKKVILTAPETEKAFQEIEPFFDKSGKEYNELVGLKNQYNKLYDDFEKQGKISLNVKAYEKSIILIKRWIRENNSNDPKMNNLYENLKKI